MDDIHYVIGTTPHLIEQARDDFEVALLFKELRAAIKEQATTVKDVVAAFQYFEQTYPKAMQRVVTARHNMGRDEFNRLQEDRKDGLFSRFLAWVVRNTNAVVRWFASWCR